MSELKTHLIKYFPPVAVNKVAQIIESEKIQLIISKKRKTKLGDYRPPQRNIKFHRISVNYNLPIDLFLLIFLHEYAHLLTWKAHKNHAIPHGNEWKKNYINLVFQFIKSNCFKSEILDLFVENINNPVKAENTIVRFHFFSEKEKVEDGLVYIEKLSPKTRFLFNNGMQFQLIEKLKKRYKCLCLNNNKFYFFQPFAKVKVFDKSNN